MHAIKFNPTSKDAEIFVPPPKPATEYRPSWYKNLPAFSSGSPEIGPDDNNPAMGWADHTLKMCVPFGDAISAGYIQEMWQDVYFDFRNGLENIRYFTSSSHPAMIMHRDTSSLPVGNEFYQKEFVFHPPWVPELPSGWSILFVSPLNRPELPIWIPSAIVDADTFTHSPESANLPFYIKKNFSKNRDGFIFKGTPIYQMIPIKRESWKSDVNPFNEVLQKRIGLGPRKYFWSGYKKMFWHKKEYK